MCKVFRNGVDISNNLWLLGVSVFIVQYGSMRFFFLFSDLHKKLLHEEEQKTSLATGILQISCYMDMYVW